MNSKQRTTLETAMAMVPQPARPCLYSYLFSHRAGRGMNQAGLAKITGVSRSTIQNIERNRVRPSVLVALRLAQALDVRVEDIFAIRYTLPSELENPRLRGRYKLVKRD